MPQTQHGVTYRVILYNESTQGLTTQIIFILKLFHNITQNTLYCTNHSTNHHDISFRTSSLIPLSIEIKTYPNFPPRKFTLKKTINYKVLLPLQFNFQLKFWTNRKRYSNSENTVFNRKNRFKSTKIIITLPCTIFEIQNFDFSSLSRLIDTGK